MAIDKNALYGTFQDSVDRNNKLTDDITRKALDLPRDDDVNITTTNNGVSGKALAGILAGVMAAGGGGAVVMNQMGQPTPQPVVQPSDQEATLTFYNSDGEEIILPQRNPGAQE